MINLRPVELRDADILYRHRTDEEVVFWAAGGLGDAFPTRAQVEETIRNQKAGDPQRTFIIEVCEDGQEPVVIGSASFSKFSRIARRVEIGISIGERTYWGKGYGTEAIRQFVQLLFTRYNLNRIDLSTFADNKRAIRCYEKCGFVVEGVLRQYYWTMNGYRDAILMGLLREDWARREGTAPRYISTDPA